MRFQLPSLATPVQTHLDELFGIQQSFNCLHWRPRFKQARSLTTDKKKGVSIAFIGDPGSNKGYCWVWVPSGFNCLHWRPRFKPLENSSSLAIIEFQLPSLAIPVQTSRFMLIYQKLSFNCLHWRYRFKRKSEYHRNRLDVSIAFIGDTGSNGSSFVSQRQLRFNCLHWRPRFKHLSQLGTKS